MIYVQKSFPPSLARRWRKVMRDNKDALAEGKPPFIRSTLAVSRPVDGDSGSLPEQSKAGSTPAASNFDRWKLAQERQRWLYNVLAGAVLCLLAFVVSEGCR